MIEKVTKQQAEAEIQAWLDKKKIFQSVREVSTLEIDILIEGIMNGCLSLDDNGSFTQTLMFPTGDTKTITYKNRMNDNMLLPHLKGVSQRDGDARQIAYAAALTDVAKGILTSLDPVDKKVMMSIVGFFI